METPTCQKCGPGIELKRIEGLFALTKVEKNKDDGGVVFFPASGIPVVVFVCPICGEMKLYPAKLLDEL